MKCLCLAALLLLAAPAPWALAQDWMFMPSYYSHDPVQPVRVRQQYSRGPAFSPSVGQYINSGYRNIRSQINVGGGTYDQLNMWDSWFQVGAKYGNYGG